MLFEVGCYTDAEFYYSYWYDLDGVPTVHEVALTPQVHKDRRGNYTLRIYGHEESGAALYARMIVAWAFNRGQGPDDFEAFKEQQWEGDHLICSDAWDVPLGRASVVCGWIKGVTKRRHIWEEWMRDAAERLKAQSEEYAACASKAVEERELRRKESDEASRAHEKAKQRWEAARERTPRVLPHILVQHRVEVQASKQKAQATEARMAKASPRLQAMWQQYVKKYQLPELTVPEQKSR